MQLFEEIIPEIEHVPWEDAGQNSEFRNRILDIMYLSYKQRKWVESDEKLFKVDEESIIK